MATWDTRDNTGTPSMIPKNPSGGAEVGAKPARLPERRPPTDRHVLIIQPIVETISTDVTQKLVGSEIDPMKDKLALRCMRKISCGSVLIIEDGAADHERLEAEANRSELAKDHMLSKPGER